MSSPAFMTSHDQAAAPTAPGAVIPPSRPELSPRAMRWFRLNQDRLRALLIGTASLIVFLIAWHLLTTYRVVFVVKFTNVPAPLAVYASFTKAIHDPKFLMHILLSCRRIFIWSRRSARVYAGMSSESTRPSWASDASRLTAPVSGRPAWTRHWDVGLMSTRAAI